MSFRLREKSRMKKSLNHDFTFCLGLFQRRFDVEKF